jgi:Tol biopolymer transport system component
MICKILGYHQIISQLGKDVMERVYRARDQKPGRDIAIKVLSVLAVLIELTAIGACTQYVRPSDSGTKSPISETAGSAAPSGKTLVWVDREGREEPLSIPPGEYRHPKISPDGTRVALTLNRPVNQQEIKQEIWIWDLVYKKMTHLTAAGSSPLWTPDSKRIVFASSRKDQSRGPRPQENRNRVSGSILWKAADGSGKAEQLASAADRLLTPCCWSRDGKTLIVCEYPLDPNASIAIGTVSMEGTHSYRLLLNDNSDESQPQISPDGRWIAYTSGESGRNEVFVRPYPQVGKDRWRISLNGGDAPLWSPGGRELFFRSAGAVVAVPLKTDPTFNFENQRVLFRGNYLAIYGHTFQTLEISPDGKRFLMLKDARLNASNAGGH